MKKYLMKAVVVAMCLAPGEAGAQQAPMTLHYDREADYFEESLPIGNGKLGALIYGGTDDNIIYLNDITLWTGKPVDRDLDKDAHQWIPKIREALFREDYQLADSLQLHVQGPNSQYFQPLGTLHIKDLGLGAITDYQRSLSLDSSIVRDSYRRDGRRIEREYFASHPDKLIAIRLRGDVDCEIALTAQIPHQTKAIPTQITMTGHALGDSRETIHFCTMLSVKTDGEVTAQDSSLTIRHAKEAIVYIVNETSFNGFDKHPVAEGAPYLEEAANDLWHTQNYSYDEFYQRHLADYQAIYDRVKLRLGGQDDAVPTETTDVLLKDYTDKGGQSRYLEALYFQYGRYLLISSSRTAGVPANLQGLWANTYQTPWNGDYHTNINVQMNHWIAEQGNLSELHLPLTDLVMRMIPSGTKTAKDFYGPDARGWVQHMMTNVWNYTAPGEHPSWGATNTGGAWLCANLWEHYCYSGDREYLETVYPALEGASRFFLSTMFHENDNGYLVTAPTSSPENSFIMDGKAVSICMGPTMDNQLVRTLQQHSRSCRCART